MGSVAGGEADHPLQGGGCKTAPGLGRPLGRGRQRHGAWLAFLIVAVLVVAGDWGTPTAGGQEVRPPISIINYTATVNVPFTAKVEFQSPYTKGRTCLFTFRAGPQRADAIASISSSRTETVVAQSPFIFHQAGAVEIVLWAVCRPNENIRTPWRFTVTVENPVPVGANIEVDGAFPGRAGSGTEWGIGIVTDRSQMPTCPANGAFSSVPCMQALGQTLTAPFPAGSWAAQFNDQPGWVDGPQDVGVCYPVWPDAVTVTFTAHPVPAGGESTSSTSPQPPWGSDFVGWGGACSGAGKAPTCTLDLAKLAPEAGQGPSPAEVVARFVAAGPPVSSPA